MVISANVNVKLVKADWLFAGSGEAEPRSVANPSAEERRVTDEGPVFEWSQMKLNPVAVNEYPAPGVIVNSI